MTSQDSKIAFTAHYPRQCFFLGIPITLAIWLGAWLLSGRLEWGHAILLFPIAVVVTTLATGRSFVLSDNRLYRGKACAKVVVDLDHAKSARFRKSPSPLFRDDAIFFLMDPKSGKGTDGYYLAVGNLRSASAASFTEEIERQIAASRAGEET